MNREMLVAAAVNGLCAADEVAKRSPMSIAEKAMKIVDAVLEIEENGYRVKENKD